MQRSAGPSTEIVQPSDSSPSNAATDGRIFLTSTTPGVGSSDTKERGTRASTGQTAEGATERASKDQSESRKVQWSSETINNEDMGKKKSKICCIYRKPHCPDDSSDEESTDSDGKNAYEKQPKYKSCQDDKHHCCL
jgi:hypothetical protein